jgi:hypothetical protein
VARKYKIQGYAAAAVEATAAKPGLARFPIATTGFPTRLKKIHTPRRRIPVTFFSERPKTVKMRHVGQNVGNLVAGTQTVQNQRI